MKQTQVKKRKYTPKKKYTGITQKFAAKPKTREIKTVDTIFPQVYTRIYVSDTLSGITFNDAPCIQNLCRIQQGAGIPNRIGNKVALKSLRIRATLEQTGNDGGAPLQNGRFMIVYDRQVNGTYPSINAILGDISVSNTVTAATYLSSINPNYFDRYIVLCDKIFIVGANQLAGADNGPTEMKQFVIDEFIKLKGLEVQYGSSTAGSPIADLNTGALYLIGFGDQTNGNEPYYMNATLRLRYYDN